MQREDHTQLQSILFSPSAIKIYPIKDPHGNKGHT